MDCSIQAQKLLLIALKTPENQQKFAQKILEKTSLKWGIYRQLQKIAVYRIYARNSLPVDRVGRPSNGQILIRCGYRSTASVDREFLRANSSPSVDRFGRPATESASVHVSVHVGRPERSTGFFGAVDRTSRPAKPGRQKSGLKSEEN